MDIRLSAAPVGVAEREAADVLLGPENDGGPGRPPRDRLLPALLAVQARVGWVSEGALNHICRRLGLPPAEAFGVASFYRMISLSPRAPAVAHVCEDLACRLKGAEALCGELERRLGAPGRDCDGRSATWQRSACLGLCDSAPAALVTRAGENPTETGLGSATAAVVLTTLESRSEAGTAAPARTPIPQSGDPALRLLRRAGRINPESLADYQAQGGFRALELAFEMGTEGILREVTASRLLGRGGAAFPTARKWEAVAKAPVHPHFLVCNADESEPGTFKDRVLLEEDPFALVEAMAIAGFATGCERGYVYIRGEYPLAAKRLDHAAVQARSQGRLGENILGSGFSFDFEIRRGGGAYICGEETALFNSIEGYRGEPRSKPPFPTTHGLFGKPTAINNVETLANIPDIVREGGEAFSALGTKESAGTRLFCVSGCIPRPGLYEIPMGTPLRDLMDLAGGVVAPRSLRTVLLGGAAGTFLSPDELDVRLSFEGTRAIGATLGSGAVMVFDDAADPWDVALRIAAFFREESCGQCVPCRVGTARQEEALKRLARSRSAGSTSKEVALLGEIGQAMRDASICGLGQTAAAAVQSALVKLGLAEGGKR